MEIWKDIPDFDNYEVSNLGNVRNKKTLVVKKQRIGKSIYEYYKKVDLSKNGYRRTTKVHRLVYEAFFGFVSSGMDIHHIDFDSMNNSLENLIVVTKDEHKQLHKDRR